MTVVGCLAPDVREFADPSIRLVWHSLLFWSEGWAHASRVGVGQPINIALRVQYCEKP